MKPEAKAAPRLTDAEWEVMRVLWRAARPLAATEAAAALEGSTGWGAATVKTLLNRLLKKGALHFEKEGKAYLYLPAFAEGAFQAAAADTFLERVFDGSLSPLLAHFAATRRLSRTELEELEQLLRKGKR